MQITFVIVMILNIIYLLGGGTSIENLNYHLAIIDIVIVSFWLDNIISEFINKGEYNDFL